MQNNPVIFKSPDDVDFVDSRNEITKQMTEALCKAYNISTGTDLVNLFGFGHETSNQEAIENWVGMAVLQFQNDCALQWLGVLVDQMEIMRIKQEKMHG